MLRTTSCVLVATLAIAGCDTEPTQQTEDIASSESEVTIGLDGRAYHSIFELEAEWRLEQLAEDPDRYRAVLDEVYGDYDPQIAEDMRQMMAAGDFSWKPVAQIVPADVMGLAAAAYSIEKNRVYINEQTVHTPMRALAYLEEIGHYLDGVLKDQDTPGDEGQLFMLRTLGLSNTPASSSPEDGVLIVDGESIAVEFGWWPDFIDDAIDAIGDGAGWVWDGIGDAASWSWDKIEEAGGWFKGTAEKTWKWMKDNINLPCLGSTVLTSVSCTGCLATVLLAPETGGGSLAGAKALCGTGCVGSALLWANACFGLSASSDGGLPQESDVGRVDQSLSRSVAFHPDFLVKAYENTAFRGNWQGYPIGEHTVNSMVLIRNDSISSLDIPAGVKVQLFAENGFWGTQSTYRGQSRYNSIGSSMNDQTSSLKVIPGVTVYDGNFSGNNNTYTTGNYRHSDFSYVYNDQISSLVTAPGIAVRLCSESGGWGSCATYDGDERITLPSSMNNQASNLEVMPGVTLYRDSFFRGAKQTVTVGTYTAAQIGAVGNDRISSMIVAPGYEAMVCAESGLWGDCETFEGAIAFVGEVLNNRTSSVRLQRIGDTPGPVVVFDPPVVAEDPVVTNPGPVVVNPIPVFPRGARP